MTRRKSDSSLSRLHVASEKTGQFLQLPRVQASHLPALYLVKCHAREKAAVCTRVACPATQPPPEGVPSRDACCASVDQRALD
jgi:hypothetical protein